MKSFTKVAGIVRIIFFEFLLLFLLVGFIANLAQDIEQGTIGSDIVYLITTFILGIICLAWIVWSIIKPKITTESGMFSSLKKYAITNFCSTHPSYVFIDAFILLGYALLFSEFEPTTTLEYYRVISTWAFAISIPVLRLFCWYVLGLKYTREQTKGAWKPVMWFYVIISPIALLLIVGLICNS